MAINSIAELSEVATETCLKFGGIQVWWRGQRSNNLEWTLKPKIYRKSFPEMTLSHTFMNAAKTRYDKCPSNDDLVGWLFLMQHYGLPTRLLDWTKSPLVALFFAVQEPDDDAGVLWALNPAELNYRQAKSKGIFIPQGTYTKGLFKQAFEKGNDKEKLVVATEVDQIDSRMLIQQSAFTIHGTPKPLEQLESKDSFLVKFDIPKSDKTSLRGELWQFGIVQSYLFPDLQHLAKNISDEEFTDFV